MAGGFQDQGGFETQMWLESGDLVLGILFLGLFCWVFYLPVLLTVCVLEMAGHEQLSHRLVSRQKVVQEEDLLPAVLEEEPPVPSHTVVPKQIPERIVKIWFPLS